MKIKTGNAHIYHNSKRFDADTEYEVEDSEGSDLLTLGAALVVPEKQPVVEAPPFDGFSIGPDPIVEELPDDQ